MALPELLWTIEADTWEEAMQKYHTFQGWEPYKPITFQTQKADHD